MKPHRFQFVVRTELRTHLSDYLSFNVVEILQLLLNIHLFSHLEVNLLSILVYFWSLALFCALGADTGAFLPALPLAIDATGSCSLSLQHQKSVRWPLSTASLLLSSPSDILIRSLYEQLMWIYTTTSEGCNPSILCRVYFCGICLVLFEKRTGFEITETFGNEYSLVHPVKNNKRH